MKRFTEILLAAALSLSTAAEADSARRSSPCPDEGAFTTLPAGIDRDSANRIWCWMKQEVNAPLDLAPPPVFVGPLPRNRYSVFVFPTPSAPNDVFSIEIGSNTMRYEDPLFVLWALGHELAHAVFTLRPFGFERQASYPMALPFTQHCDPEFGRVTKGAADVIWNIFHSSQQRSRMQALDREQYGRECAFLANAPDRALRPIPGPGSREQK
ncbi:MAG: hypothetical protein ACK2UN_18740 [Candidatus Promineifilaceae bacterium]|jgi:hypothetical protein